MYVYLKYNLSGILAPTRLFLSNCVSASRNIHEAGISSYHISIRHICDFYSILIISTFCDLCSCYSNLSFFEKSRFLCIILHFILFEKSCMHSHCAMQCDANVHCDLGSNSRWRRHHYHDIQLELLLCNLPIEEIYPKGHLLILTPYVCTCER